VNDARRLWLAFEPIHALVYFAAEPADAFTALGLKGFWMGYFASRSAPMGPVPPSVVTATFHGFAPWMVERALPDAWQRATPEAVLAARYDGIDAALRRVLGPDADGPSVSRAATLARETCYPLSAAGRPLFAAHAALPWPDAPHLVLWHAATLLREHRGDGHVSALTAAGIDGCASQVLQVGRGVADREDLQRTRGWSDDDWAMAEAQLEARGWLASGQLTAKGRKFRARLEAETDALAAPHGTDAAELLALVEPLADVVAASGDIRYPNPIGLPPRGSG
jgi:hypothetical protein